MDNCFLQEKYVSNAVAVWASIFYRFYLYIQDKSIWSTAKYSALKKVVFYLILYTSITLTSSTVQSHTCTREILQQFHTCVLQSERAQSHKCVL